jgi:hypothetical protein
VIEQPASSLLSYHPKFRFLLDLASKGWCRMDRLHVWMGLYGCHSPKPSELWVTHDWAVAFSLGKSEGVPIVMYALGITTPPRPPQ